MAKPSYISITKSTEKEKHMAVNIVRVHRPNLTPEEYAKRLEGIKRAAENLVMATQRQKQTKKKG